MFFIFCAGVCRLGCFVFAFCFGVVGLVVFFVLVVVVRWSICLGVYVSLGVSFVFLCVFLFCLWSCFWEF